jgi:AmmeMemoRadiSam system protein A
MQAYRFFRVLIPFCLIAMMPYPAKDASAGRDGEDRGGTGQTVVNRPVGSSALEGKKEGVMEDKGKVTEEEGRYLLRVARRTIEGQLFNRGEQDKSDQNEPPVCRDRRGTFVTLTMDGNLRGCIGHIVPQESLIEGIRVNAINAAFRDPRFRPLTANEWGNVKIEISILTDPEPLHYTDAKDLLEKLRPGIDGVIIRKGYYQSTFLPQVWEQLPKREDFLKHLCLKAGLSGDAWRKADLDVSTYQVQAFEE